MDTTDFLFLKPSLISDTGTLNGGRPSTETVVSSVKNNLFPDVTLEDRTQGLERWRKLFLVRRNSSDAPFKTPRVSLERPTSGDGYLLLYAGAATETQDQVTGRPYGVGTLAASVDAGAQTLTLTAEADFSAWASPPFQVGDTLRVDARSNVLADGSSEYVEIDTVAYTDGSTTITLTLVSGLSYAYDAGAIVASVWAAADMQASIEGVGFSGTGSYDGAGLSVAQPGARYQIWQVLVTDASSGTLEVSGDTLGSVASGSLDSDLAPTNPEGGVYFTLPASSWSGTESAGDVLTFTTVPAMLSAWLCQVTPAGASATTSDGGFICIEGVSE